MFFRPLIFNLIARRTYARFPYMMSDQVNKVIVKHQTGEETFTFSFNINNPELKINRQFNMSRSIQESLQSFMVRLNANLEKSLIKSKKTKSKPNPVVPESVGVDLTVTFFTNGEQLEPDMSLPVSDFLFQPNLSMRIFEENFDVQINPPLVESLRLPNSIMAGFFVYPTKLKLQFASISESKFEWYVTNQTFKETPQLKTYEWVKCGEGLLYVPAVDNVNRLLRVVCTPIQNGNVGVPGETFNTNLISAGPGFCPFEIRHQFTQDFLPENEFRVLSYNLLADLYADSDFSRESLHPQCPPYALDIEYRKQLLIKEIFGFHSDLMCLQEVDTKIFNYDLKVVLEKHGYSGLHACKGGQVSEGVACFWRSNRFSLVDHERVVMAEAMSQLDSFKDLKEKISENIELMESVLSRSTVLVTVALEDVNSNGSRGILVANTHLYFRPDADHIRLIQTAFCLRQISLKLDQLKVSKPETKFSIIFCGDFNSTPPFGVLELIRTGKIPKSHPDWSSCPGQETKNIDLSHPFKMDSACGTPEYTTYTIGFKDCLDYIFFDTEAFDVTSVIPFPLTETLEEQLGIPNVTFPSDHIACVADLKWKS